MAQPTVLGCSSRAGTRSSDGASPVKRYCDRRERNRISPIQRNKGRAVSVQLDDAPQMVMAMASPAGRLENNSIPSQAVPARVRPTHTPPARNPKMDTTSMVMTKIGRESCRARRCQYVEQLGVAE